MVKRKTAAYETYAEGRAWEIKEKAHWADNDRWRGLLARLT
jgi:hypothetical protein